MESQEFIVAQLSCSCTRSNLSGWVVRVNQADDNIYGISYHDAAQAWINLLGKLGAC